MNLLFICTMNQWRSLTAEHIFQNISGIQVRSAGTATNARHHINTKDLHWADSIFVMEQKHKEYIEKNFPGSTASKRIVNLNIPDEYGYLDPDLVKILQVEVSAVIKKQTSLAPFQKQKKTI